MAGRLRETRVEPELAGSAGVPCAVLDAVPSSFVLVDADDVVCAANRAVHEVLGHEPDALVGVGLAETLVEPAHREAYRAQLRRAADAGPGPQADGSERISITRADDTVVPVDVTIRPIAGAEPPQFGVCLREVPGSAPAPSSVALDAAEGRRRTLHTVLDAIPDPVVAVNRSGRIIFRNRASARTLGRSGAGQRGARDTLAPEQWRKAETVMRSGTPVFGEEESDPAGGICRTTRIPVLNQAGAAVGLVAISRDITAQKAGEDRLLSEKQAAEAAARANSEFLATTSHEVRTLMSGVTGMTTLLLDTDLSDEQRDFVDTIRNSGDALLRVVHDVLDLSKIDAGMLELETRTFSVRRVVRDSLGMVAQQAATKGLELATEIADSVPDAVIGDPVRVQQVLVNLLTNALKFTDDGSVRVRVALAAPAADGRSTLAFSVEDTGVGIAPDRLEAVFERFVQADASTSRTHGGTGLGLAICRRLVGMMGGEMRVESVQGGGSAFSFTMVVQLSDDGSGDGAAVAVPAPQALVPAPATAPDLDAEEESAPDTSGPTKMMDAASILPSARVLLAEDDKVMQKVTALTLQRLGYRPTVVDNGAKAVMAIRSQSYDLVLMDVMMPVMDGLEATRQIRADPGTHPMPAIVALTANAMEGDRERCFDAGCDDYLSKPVTPRHLAATIEQAIRVRADAAAAA